MAKVSSLLVGFASFCALAITSAIAACPTHPIGLSQSTIGGQNQFISVARKSFSIESDLSVEDAKETATITAKANLAQSFQITRLQGVKVLFTCSSGDKVFVGVSATHHSESAAKLLGKQLEKSFHLTSTPKPLSPYTNR